MRHPKPRPALLALAATLLSVSATRQQEPPELLQAINAGDVSKVAELLDEGADPNMVFHDRTPLMYAVYEQQVEIFRLLAERGADLEMRTERAGPIITVAAEGGNLDILGLLLERGVDVDAREQDGQTALMLAAHNGHPEAVRLLIAKGAAVDAQEGSGWSALMFAAMGGDLDSVRYLIEGGCDVDIRTNDGESPLDRARLLAEHKLGNGQYDEVVEALIAAGAGSG